MPQGRRKVPFSSKQKKIQLQQKREKKYSSLGEGSTVVSTLSTPKETSNEVEVVNEQPTHSAKNHPNRYRLVFKKEKNEDVKKRQALAYEPFDPLPEEKLEVSYEDVFIPGSELDMPKRPMWDYTFTKEQLETREQKYFRGYIENLEHRFGEDQLSHFEMNLETWRQLWRVLEFSDIVLLVTDIRYPVYHFSPALYDYVTKDLKKDMILVLNKIDLVPASLVLAWKEYFKQHFPLLNIMCFASYAGMILKDGKKGRRIGNLHMAIEGARHLSKMCETIVKDQVDISSWKRKIETEASQINSVGDTYINSESEEDESDEERNTSKRDKTIIKKYQNDTSQYQEQRYKDNILTIGFVGHPNVGKSSFLNAVLGRKVASVSRTPGHTKHYQTIMLTPNVRLCDCPGLVFPSLVPKAVQVLMGCYPISQLREPYSVIAFLSQRVPVHSILKLRHPDYESVEKEKELKWSAHEICEAWAIKRGFQTARSARPDVYRAANNILRLALDGRTICLAFYPPNFTKEKEMWSEHPGLIDIIATQAHRQKHEEKNHRNFDDFNSKFTSLAKVSNNHGDCKDVDEYNSDDTEDSDDSSGAPSDNKFGLLGDDIHC